MTEGSEVSKECFEVPHGRLADQVDQTLLFLFVVDKEFDGDWMVVVGYEHFTFFDEACHLLIDVDVCSDGVGFKIVGHIRQRRVMGLELATKVAELAGKQADPEVLEADQALVVEELEGSQVATKVV